MNFQALRHGAFASSLVVLGAASLLACGGKATSNDPTSTQLQPVSATEVAGAVAACGAGYAHPNVCCTSGAGAAAACGVYPTAPFHACDASSVTYPDPRSCCPLDGAGQCVTPPPAPISPPPSSCQYACPAGQYSPGDGSGACCQTDPSGATVCSGGGVLFTGSGAGSSGSSGAGSSGSSSGSSPGSGMTGSGTTCTSCACACPAQGPCPPCDCPPPDPSCGAPPPPAPTPTPVCGLNEVGCGCPACVEGQPCPPCDCGPVDPCPPPSCDACPPGWQSPSSSSGDAYLCCQEDADGTVCFSQAVPPPPVPVGTPVGGGVGGVGGTGVVPASGG